LKAKLIMRRLFCLLIILCLVPMSVLAVGNPPSQAGDRKLEGGQRDFKWPVPGEYNLSSCFLDNREHYSLDIAAPSGTPVVASYAGKVLEVGENASWGNFVLLEHAYALKDGSGVTLYSRYAHLTEATVAAEEAVTAGQQIGTVGSTGDSSGPHLDFDILCGGTAPSSTYSLDPYINELLELPPALYTTFGECCQEYVAYVKEFYGAKDTPVTGPSVIKGHFSTLKNGQVLWKESYSLDGTVTSTYPIRKINGYLDGKLYASWSTEAELYRKDLLTTPLNLKLEFKDMSLGEHTLALGVEDSTGSGEVRVVECTFIIAEKPQMITITFATDPQSTMTVPAGQPLGVLPVPQGNGHPFIGWFTERNGGEMVTAETVPTAPMTLYPRWEVPTCTVMAGDVELTVAQGQCITAFPTLEKEGYRIVGWFMKSGEEITTSTPIMQDMILQPKWEIAPCKVTFDPTGGHLEEKEIYVYLGEVYGTLPTPKRDGYNFMGWKLNGDPISEETVVAVGEDHTLVAVWQRSYDALVTVIVAVLGSGAVAGGIYLCIQWRRRRMDIFL